jgi:phosphoglycolate phosphatase
MSFVVGFDLDMTLVDSADGIADALQKVFADHGVPVARDDVLATIGLPLDMVFPMWLPNDSYEQLLDEYREYYGRFGIPQSRLLPGARDAVDAIHEAGGRVVVVSAKKKDFVDRVVDVVQLPVDVTYGYVFAEAKGKALLAEHAAIYVGDHEGDIRAARAANAVSFIVTSGPMSRAELLEHEPDVIVESLVEFRPWLELWLASRPA